MGDRKVIWDKSKAPTMYHAFRVDHASDKWGIESSSILLFDQSTKELAYIEMIKPFFVVFELENGLAERTFTDEDFKDVKTQCPAHQFSFSARKPKNDDSFSDPISSAFIGYI